MKFVAWRGLSDKYRSAVNGHSPWEQGETNAEPFGIDDISRSHESDELKSAVTRENIAALAFIPLIANGVLIGKFMVYYDTPHLFSAREFELAVMIANHIANAVERRRIEERRRQTEAALRDNDARLRLATRTGKVGVWDWDIQADVVSWSDSLYTMLGVDPSTFDGSLATFESLLHPDDLDRVRQSIDRALSGGRYELEFRIVRPDKAIVWLFTNATVLKGADEPVRMIGATVDITEIKLAEVETRKLAAIVETTQDAIVSKDLHSVILSWNRGAEHVFGYSADEAVGQSILMVIPEDRRQ